MSIGHSRYYENFDIGIVDPSKLKETVGKVPLEHKAGIRGYDASQMNVISRFFNGLVGNTIDYTDPTTRKTIALNRKSLEAFMVRNSIIKSRKEFDPKTAVKLLKAHLETLGSGRKVMPQPTAKELPVQFTEDKIILSKSGLEQIFNGIGLKAQFRSKVEAALPEANGKFVITRNEFNSALQGVMQGISDKHNVPEELQPLIMDFVKFLKTGSKQDEEQVKRDAAKVLPHAPEPAPAAAPVAAPAPGPLDLGDLKDFDTFQLKTKRGETWTNPSILSAVNRLSLPAGQLINQAYANRTPVRDLQQVAAFLWVNGGGWKENKCKTVFNNFLLLEKAIVLCCAKEQPPINKPVDKSRVENDRKEMMKVLAEAYKKADEVEKGKLDAFLNTHEKGMELKAELKDAKIDLKA